MSYIENLKNNIERLLELENQADEYKNRLNQLKTDIDYANKNIMQIMENNGITQKDIVIGDKKIKYITQNTQEVITKKLIIEKSRQFFQNEDQSNKFVNFLYNDRNLVTKKLIKITDNKRKM